jgi:hypothetical protein
MSEANKLNLQKLTNHENQTHNENCKPKYEHTQISAATKHEIRERPDRGTVRPDHE